MNEKLEAIVARLDNRDGWQPLSPLRVWDEELETQLEKLELPGKRSDTRAIALMAGLHLRNDSLDASHAYAQEIEHDATGAYWHGIMHRMEGDYSNCKYWFMQAGNHPVKEKVRLRVAEWLRSPEASLLDELPPGRLRDTIQSYKRDGAWHSSTFADAIAAVERQAAEAEGAAAARALLERIQHIEMTELFRHTLAAADVR